MIKFKSLFYVIISFLVVLPIFTYAETFINNNGVQITDEDYEKFSKAYDDNYIMNMTQEKYDKLQTLDFNNIDRVTKYYEMSYNRSLNLVTEREITEAEYDNFTPGGLSSSNGGDNPRLGNGTAHYETVAKELNLVLIGGSYYNNVSLTATWKLIPGTRSFDVIGFRGYGFSFRTGSQEGTQAYITSDDVYHTISYAWNGTNIKKFSDGFGISMNLVNNTIKAIQCMIECDISPTIDHPSIYGSYQHAVASVSLANSQNYTLGGGGLGNVFIYPYNISQKYDGMTGLSLTY